MHKALGCRPSDRLAEERESMTPLPTTRPDTDRRWVLRVPPDPYLRFDTCDYSLDPRLVGRRVEARVSEREVLAVALDTGCAAPGSPDTWLACGRGSCQGGVSAGERGAGLAG
jgi:hypothetical protein